MMNRRSLGRTGLQVSELSLGGLFVSKVGGPFEQGRAAALHAFANGVNYVDTAPSYADSEQVLGRILPELDEPPILSTKLGARHSPFEPQNPDHLHESVRASLRLLNRDRIDILFVHEPDRPGHHDWWSDKQAYTGPVLDVLDELKADGVIGYTGLGGTSAYSMAPIMATGRFDVVLTAFQYSLLWREAEQEILPMARQLDMGVVIGSPLQQGALAQRHDDEVRHGARWLSEPRRRQLLDLYALLDEVDLSLPELALRWVLSNPEISCTLTGARSQQEIDANLKAPLPGRCRRICSNASMNWRHASHFDRARNLPYSHLGETFLDWARCAEGSKFAPMTVDLIRSL
jgi:aryl-alcohol dehydrogenase-like predicted oxidoreductase